MSTDDIKRAQPTAACAAPGGSAGSGNPSSSPQPGVADKAIHDRFWEAHRERFDLIPYVLPLLAEGEPVTLDQVAAASSRPVQDIKAALRQHPGVDWDERGRLAGFGLTLRPTPHRFTFDGRTVYGWCATDTLIFPVALGRSGLIESACPATGRAIRIDVTPHGVEKIDPPDAVVSLIRPATVDDMRAQACDLGGFFASREATADWLATHPEGMIHTIEEDFQLNRDTFESFGWAHLGIGAR